LVITADFGSGRAFLGGWWWTIALGVVVLLVALYGAHRRHTFEHITASRLTALVVFIAVPSSLILVGGVLLFPTRYQVPAL
jgi:hypothetical protein